jgi:hypothetical protein
MGLIAGHFGKYHVAIKKRSIMYRIIEIQIKFHITWKKPDLNIQELSFYGKMGDNVR